MKLQLSERRTEKKTRTHLWRPLAQQNTQRLQDRVAESWTDGHPLDNLLDTVNNNDTQRTLVRIIEDLVEVGNLLRFPHADHILG